MCNQLKYAGFQDDVCPADGFAPKLRAALAELPTLDPNWDVLLVGALGCIHPRHRYGANLIVGAAAGGLRYPRELSATISIPLRPMGTHAYVLSPAGARALLARCPRANFHVDVAAWGETSLRLYLVSDPNNGSLLALQAMLAYTQQPHVVQPATPRDPACILDPACNPT